ncbi:MAG TPA: hypothetical protein VJT32_03140 [bacterium]|nr:hypothetical protein [bacterium]
MIVTQDYLSSVAARLLQRDGVTEVADLVGGVAAWKASPLQIA